MDGSLWWNTITMRCRSRDKLQGCLPGMAEGLRQIWVAGQMSAPLRFTTFDRYGPRGLPKDAEDYDDGHLCSLRRYEARLGSERLLDAILRANGIEPPRRRKLKPPRPKPVKSAPPAPVYDEMPEIARIQTIVANYYGVDVAQMAAKNKRDAWPRQVAMYLARKLENTPPFKEIGRNFGGRDHSTIMHGVALVERRIASDPERAQDIEAIRKALEE